VFSRNQLLPTFFDFRLAAPVSGLEDAEADVVVAVGGGVFVEQLQTWLGMFNRVGDREGV